MHIESIPIERIDPAAYNPRIDLQPGDRDYDRLQRSMDEFGFVEPLVWNRRTGNLVGGHQRLKILAARGVGRIEVSVVDLPLQRERALNVALNKIGGDWDERKLAELLDPGVKPGLTDPDEVPEPPDEPITQAGDLWLLGEHQLLCGDAGSVADIDPLLDGQPIHLFNTDPLEVKPRA